MVTPEMFSYIDRELKSGKNRDQIKLSLIQGGGWKGSDVDEAFARLDHPHATKPPRTHSSGITFIFLLVLIVAAAYFIMQRYNIHSLQDVKTFALALVARLKGLQGM
ncbi:MAG TPA: hypothetical protein VG621_00840 [Candidatus Paceibacterota bacterium]|nr:hypothetical protein [Candidatus Paceibacterota bacterium]